MLRTEVSSPIQAGEIMLCFTVCPSKAGDQVSLPGFKICPEFMAHADAGIWGFLADEYNTAKGLLGCKEKPEKNKDVLLLVTYCGVRMLF